MYDAASQQTLAAEFAGVSQAYDTLIALYTAHDYQTAQGNEYALHGFGRRLTVLKECIEALFQAIPVELDRLPTDKERAAATIAMQAFLINVFGCADNLARVWVAERDVRGKWGAPLKDGQIGLGWRYSRVRKSFPANFQDYLRSRRKWFVEMQKFRHALAHRISPYIPPYAVDPTNQQAHNALDAQIHAAAQNHDFVAAEALTAQQLGMRFFRPWMTHSFSENAPMLILHAQMLSDFKTIDEMARKIMEELKRPPVRTGGRMQQICNKMWKIPPFSWLGKIL